MHPPAGGRRIGRHPRQGGGAGARVRSCRAGRPFAGPPRAQPHKALALDSVIWFSIPSTGTPTSNIPDASVARRGTVVVLSLCEAAKREFGGFVQRVFRGFTSTIKLGVFEHPTVWRGPWRPRIQTSRVNPTINRRGAWSHSLSLGSSR